MPPNTQLSLLDFGCSELIGFVLAVVSLLLLTAAMFTLPIALPKLWRGDSTFGKSVPSAWPYDEATWRGCMRAMPCLVVGGPGLVIAGWCFMLWTSIDGYYFVSDPTVRWWLPLGAVFGAGCTVLAFAAGLSVFLFNRPRGIVPPHLRSEPGAFNDWFGS